MRAQQLGSGGDGTTVQAADGDGFQQGLTYRQRKRLRQRAARNDAVANGEGTEQGRRDDQHVRHSDDDRMAEDQETEEDVPTIPPPFQEPPLPRLLLVTHCEHLRKRVEQLGAKKAPQHIQQKAKQRLDATQQQLRQAGGATEKRMLFSIMAEDDKIQKLLAAGRKNQEAIVAARAERDKLDRRIANLQVGTAAIQRRLDNARQRRAYLSAQNAAETIPPETTTSVQHALEQLLGAAGPAMEQQAALVSEYFRRVAPVGTRGPGEYQDVDLSEGETIPDPEVEMRGCEHETGGAASSSSGAAQVRPSAEGEATPQLAVVPAGALLPNRLPDDLEAAAELVEGLRRQRMLAVEATFNRPSDQTEVGPSLSGPQVVDRYDSVLRIAINNLERVRHREQHAAPPQVPPPSELAVHVGDEAGQAQEPEVHAGFVLREEAVPIIQPPNPTGAAMGQQTAEQMLDEQLAQHRRRQQQQDEHHAPLQLADDVHQASPEQVRQVRRRTRWEQPNEPSALAAALPALLPMVQQCPGCGTGPMPEAALVGFCSCCAAVCGDCSSGGTVDINSCLYCNAAQRQEVQTAVSRHPASDDDMDQSEPQGDPQQPGCSEEEGEPGASSKGATRGTGAAARAAPY